MTNKQQSPLLQQPQPLLKVSDLSVEYVGHTGSVRAVDEISFSIRENEIFGLAGESGSGKSTAAMAIMRLLQSPALITSGSALFRGEDIFVMTEEELRAFRWKKIALVFQSAMNALNPVITIGAQIVDVILAHEDQTRKEALERAAHLLHLVGLPSSLIMKYPHQLSGGMRQRVTIAIALSLSPPLLFMDEPTTALDVVVQKEILHEIAELKEKLGFSILFITHDLNLMFEFCDTIGVLYAGRFCEIAPAARLLNHPLHPYTQGLLGSAPQLFGPPQRVSGIAGSPPQLSQLPQGCRFHPRCAKKQATCLESPPLLSELYPKHQVACTQVEPKPLSPEIAQVSPT